MSKFKSDLQTKDYPLLVKLKNTQSKNVSQFIKYNKTYSTTKRSLKSKLEKFTQEPFSRFFSLNRKHKFLMGIANFKTTQKK